MKFFRTFSGLLKLFLWLIKTELKRIQENENLAAFTLFVQMWNYDFQFKQVKNFHLNINEISFILVTVFDIVFARCRKLRSSSTTTPTSTAASRLSTRRLPTTATGRVTRRTTFVKLFTTKRPSHWASLVLLKSACIRLVKGLLHYF